MSLPESRPIVWICKVGSLAPNQLPNGADGPMRDAVAEAFRGLTGGYPEFCFSGWGGDLTEAERLIVEDRVPEMADHYIFAGPGGACMSSRPIEGLTQDLTTLGSEATPEDHIRAKERCNYYKGRYFVCETMTESAMRKLAAVLGLKFREIL